MPGPLAGVGDTAGRKNVFALTGPVFDGERMKKQKVLKVISGNDKCQVMKKTKAG